MSEQYDNPTDNEVSLDDVDNILDSDNIIVTEGHGNQDAGNTDPIDNSGDEPNDEPNDEPSNKPTDEPNDGGEDFNDDKPTDEPTDDPADEPNDEPSDEPTNEVDNEAYYEYLGDLSEQTGVELSSEEDIVTALNELYEYKTATPVEIPKEAQMVADLINSGGDYRSKLRLLSLDTENLNDKDALKESFFLTNEVERSNELAGMQFERDFSNKYGILDKVNKITDPDEKAEFEQENKEEIKYAKLSYEQDVKNAKGQVSKFIEESTTLPSDDGSMSEEEANEIYENHVNNVNHTLNSFEGVELPLGESGKDSFNLTLSDEDRPLLQEVLTNPIDYFRETVGVDMKTGEILDYNQLSSIFTVIQNWDRLAPVLGQYYMEQTDKKTLEEITENREKPKNTSSKPKNEGQGISLDDDPDFE